MHYLFNETEIRFYKKYKLFPDELFQQLQNLGFSRESFKPIQKEMDRRDGQKGQDPGQIQANIPLCAVSSRHDVLLLSLIHI